MDPKSRARITEFIASAVFYLFPAAIAVAAYCLAGHFGFAVTLPIVTSNFDLEIAICSSLVGYSFTAGFFLVALPRQGFLERLDKTGKTMPYAIAVLQPSIWGIICLFSIFSSTKWLTGSLVIVHLAYFGLFATFISFLWSLFVITRIVAGQRKYSKT